jgi:hypothetical protein
VYICKYLPKPLPMKSSRIILLGALCTAVALTGCSNNDSNNDKTEKPISNEQPADTKAPEVVAESSSSPKTEPTETTKKPAQEQAPKKQEKTNTTKREETSVRKQEKKVSVDGIYSGSKTITYGVELAARLTISGSRWSTVSQLTYDSPQYERGVVDGTNLYDESATIKVGNVSGNTARINGYPAMKKE